MTLSNPKRRELIHTREIKCVGYKRDDGLWDIEANMKDLKSYEFNSDHRGIVKVGNAVHDMWIRLTLNNKLEIIEIEASTDSSPYKDCPLIIPNYQKLKGLIIGPGWRKLVNSRLIGVNGCTHLTELLGPIATTAFQTIYSYNLKNNKTAKPSKSLINSCHIYSENSSLVKKNFN